MKDNQKGFLGSFLSKGLKTNQLEVNTDEKTLRPIARLKEPRDLFALPKDKDNDCSQQLPRWPIECQVIEERIKHIPSVPQEPEPFYQPTGHELKPNPVGEENGIVVFNYNPISAVNYAKTKKSRSKSHIPDDSSDSDVSSCESQASSPDVTRICGGDDKVQQTITKLLNSLEQRSSSNSNDDDDDDEDDEDDDDDEDTEEDRDPDSATKQDKKHKHKKTITEEEPPPSITEEEIDNIWADKSPEYMAATPTYIKNQIDKNVKAQQQKIIPPVREDCKEIALNRFSTPSTSSNSSYDDCLNEVGENISPSQDNEYRKYKENPLFNQDMSINLNQLVELANKTEKKENSPMKEESKTKTQQIPNPSKESFNSSFEFSCPKASTSAQSTPYSSHNSVLDYAKDNKSIRKPSNLPPQFSRSAIGGAKFLTNCHPYNPEDYDGLEFESRFESGNLAKAIQITPTYYELYLRPDLYTSRSKQWFYFRVKKTKKNMIYRFSIVNLIKSDSLYNEGMRPVMYSTISANTKNIGWKRCGENICYYRNDDDQPSEDDEDNSSYTLTFNIEFEHDNDTVFFAHSFPYTYSDLQDYLMDIQKHPIKSKYCKLRLLCRTLAGNNVYYLTVTTPVANEEVMKRKKAIVISARVHPSETPSSWMMKGLMDFITGDSSVAKRLRHKFIFKLIPMLNPDGVIVGNTRNSLTGKDLNRQYRTVIRETYPSIWYTKALIKRLIDDCGVSMYCDMHAHSRRHNIFIYGCENKRNAEKKLTEQVFPLMLHKNVADKFSFENCKFKVQRSKEGTGRIVVWMLGITNSYTIEASFGGSLLGSRKGTHFTTADYEHMGRTFCETLLDYCDENPTKECLRLKIIERLLKEGSSAEEPINIQLSDYSSDEGSSSSSDEGRSQTIRTSDLEGPCCHPLRAPPCSPELDIEIRKFRYGRMRKVMQELDRIYFQPLFHKKCQLLLKVKRSPFKKRKRKLKKNPSVTRLTPNSNSFVTSRLDSNCQTPQSVQSSKVVLRYVNLQRDKNTSISNISSNATIVPKSPSETLSISQGSKIIAKKRLKGGQEPVKKPHIKVSRKLRLWLNKRQIFIIRRKLPTRFKLRLKSLHRRKKDERLLLDMPTTDPGSDLLFSTDDEYVDTNTIFCSYGTMPRIRRNLLKSELQRRYIEEIGDGLRNMPPELIITSPSNKSKQRNHTARITMYKTSNAKNEYNPQTANELPQIGLQQPAKRTSSWHNLNAPNQSPIVSLYKQGVSASTKNKNQNPFYRTFPKNEPLSKEELDIKLSLKKKIWTGMQPDENTLTVDRNRPLSWMSSTQAHGANSKKITGLNRYQIGITKAQKLENEALLAACRHKLMEWQTQNSNSDSPRCSNSKTPLKLTVPCAAEQAAMYLFSNLGQIKKDTTTSSIINVVESDYSRTRHNRNTISTIVDASKIFTKLSKSKSRINLASTNHGRSVTKPTTKCHTRNNKFKTNSLVVTAIQPGAAVREMGGGAIKKNKKTKSLQAKLSSTIKTSNTYNANLVENRRQSVQNQTKSGNSSEGMLMSAATNANIARKVKTKLKKKKSEVNSQKSINLNAS